MLLLARDVKRRDTLWLAMSGNVDEWVWDSGYRKYDSSTTDPVCADASNPERVFRGGSSLDDARNRYKSLCMRVSFRESLKASLREGFQGFRFLRTA